MAAKLMEITAILKEIRWPPNTDTFFIAKLSPVNQNDIDAFGKIFTAVGNGTEEELKTLLTYRWFGRWTENDRFGPQFKLDTWTPAKPHGKAGVVKYLTNAPHIGEATAIQLWNEFQGEAVRIAREHPEIIAEKVKRLTLDKAKEVAAYLDEQRALEDTSIDLIETLAGRGFPKGTTREAMRVWGARAPAIINADPYKLMRFRGCGFGKCDKMYLDLGLPPGRMKRQVCCSWHAIATERDGHVWLPISKAVEGLKEKIAGVELEPDKAIAIAKRFGALSTMRDCFHCRRTGTIRRINLFTGDEMLAACPKCNGTGGREWIAETKRTDSERRVIERVADMIGWERHWPSIDGPEFATLTEHQREELRRATGGAIGAFCGSPGAGKAQPLYCKVLTPSGWKTMGDMKAGDYVLSPQGKRVRVKAVFPQGKKECFKVTMSDGSSTECCGEHLWFTTTKRERDLIRKGSLPRHSNGKVRDLNTIAKTINRPGDDSANHEIPIVSEIEFDEQELPIHPYLLGVLIGNGCFRAKSVGLTTQDTDIIEKISSMVPDGHTVKPAKDDPIGYFIRRPDGVKRNTVKQQLIELGLDGKKSVDKFIPKQYLFASKNSRIELLRGLFDTDGHAGRHIVEYSTSSEQLCRDVVELVQSLGGTTAVNSKIPVYTHKGERRNGARSYRLHVKMPNEINPFSLARKANANHHRVKYFPTRKIVSIESVGMRECQCISVDSRDGLYVTDDYIVTHNTWSTAALVRAIVKRHGQHSIAICCPTGKAAQRAKEAMRAHGVNVEATTVHRMLGVEQADDGGGWTFAHNEGNTLPFQFVIGDEWSMCGLGLMSSVLRAFARGTNFLMVGDINQLLPVEYGAPLRDLIDVVPYGELKEIHRNAGSVVKACAAIRDGREIMFDQKMEIDRTDENGEKLPPKNLVIYPADAANAQRKLIELVKTIAADKGRFPGFDPIRDIQVLVAVNKRSDLSRRTLGPILQNILNPRGQGVNGSPFRVGDKVMQTKNAFLKLKDSFSDGPESKVLVCNGEFGIVKEVSATKTVVEFPNPSRVVLIPKFKSDDTDKQNGKGKKEDDASEEGDGTGCDLVLGYATTVWKMQGSSAPIIVGVIDEYAGATGPYGNCDRAFAYTMISRVEREGHLIGQRATLKTVCKRVFIAKRKTFTKELLLEELANRGTSGGVVEPGNVDVTVNETKAEAETLDEVAS